MRDRKKVRQAVSRLRFWVRIMKKGGEKMRIGFITDCQAAEFSKRYQACDYDGAADIYVFGFHGQPQVCYEKELKGESDFFERVANFSRRVKGLVVCGCITDTRGHKRKSALIAEKGRLLGVSDALHAIDGEVGSGASLRVYDTSIGRMGVAVAEDIIFTDVIRSLTLCGSDFIVCPYGKTGQMQGVLLRASAYCYGVPIIFCGDGYGMVVENSGEIAFASPLSTAFFTLKNQKEYHLVETRRRGVWD